MSKGGKLSRRHFLRLTAFSTTSAILAACSGADTVQYAQTLTMNGDLERFGFHFIVRGTSDPWMEPLQAPSRRQERHTKQKLESLAFHTTLMPVFGPMLDWAFCQCRLQPLAPRTDDDTRIADLLKRELILFNVLVALEWTPDERYVAQLRSAFEQAADLLYDVTDGYMTFGQVVIGGPELMHVADIQIFASNRLFPRSAVNGLTVPEKYQPIRLGRGLWNKQQRTTIAWNQADDSRREFGPQTLVHEWGHYALGMKDQYLRLEEQRFVVPSLSLVTHTIMADLRTTELSTRGEDDDNEWQLLSLHPQYQSLGIAASHQPREAVEPLVPMPTFHVVGSAAGAGQSLRLRRQDTVFETYAIDPAHCWVYVVKGDVADPIGLIAQGSFEAADDFWLLGAAIGDSVVLIGNQHDAPSRPLVLWAPILGNTGGIAQMGAWHDATPQPYPIVDVAASGESAAPPYRIELTGFRPQDWNMITFPLGEGKRVGAVLPDLTVLDGHVMLVSTDAARPALAIASYSLGGSAFSGYPGHANPIPAGSSDGNAMLFFYDEERARLRYADIYAGKGKRFDGSKVVVTTNLHGSAPPEGWQPRSYTFSVTSNTSFQKLIDLHPTLVLYYDQRPREDDDGELVIGRYNPYSHSWEAIETTNRRADFLAAASFEQLQGQWGLLADPPEPDHFRLFQRAAAAAS